MTEFFDVLKGIGIGLGIAAMLVAALTVMELIRRARPNSMMDWPTRRKWWRK